MDINHEIRENSHFENVHENMLYFIKFKITFFETFE